MKSVTKAEEGSAGGHPVLTDEDVAYVKSNFRRQTGAECSRAASGVAPQPAYVLPDGTPMVPIEPDEELAAACHYEDLDRRFTRRWLDAGGRPEDAPAELASWLGGGYGVCLRSPGPELILAKEAIAQAIAALIARPMSREPWWRGALASAVAAYDALILPFASVDSERFGGPTSRMLLVDAVRERWPEVFDGRSHPHTTLASRQQT